MASNGSLDFFKQIKPNAKIVVLRPVCSSKKVMKISVGFFLCVSQPARKIKLAKVSVSIKAII